MTANKPFDEFWSQTDLARTRTRLTVAEARQIARKAFVAGIKLQRDREQERRAKAERIRQGRLAIQRWNRGIR